MKIGNIIVHPWSRKNFIYRLLAIGLILGWLMWGLVIFQEGRKIEAAIQARQMERMRKEERLRRAAAYEQSRIQERFEKNATKNAVDNLAN